MMWILGVILITRKIPIDLVFAIYVLPKRTSRQLDGKSRVEACHRVSGYHISWFGRLVNIMFLTWHCRVDSFIVTWDSLLQVVAACVFTLRGLRPMPLTHARQLSDLQSVLMCVFLPMIFWVNSCGWKVWESGEPRAIRLVWIDPLWWSSLFGRLFVIAAQ